MKKRLRKKLRLREFAGHGVSLNVSFEGNLTNDAFGVFVDEFIEGAIKSNGLLFGGGGSCTAGWNGVIDPHQQRSERRSSRISSVVTPCLPVPTDARKASSRCNYSLRRCSPPVAGAVGLTSSNASRTKRSSRVAVALSTDRRV